MLKELLLKNRSYRRFYEEHIIDHETLKELVELARLSPTGGNRQPLKFILSCDPQKNALIFPHLMWAGYLKDWPGPSVGERPSAYIIILKDTEIGAAWEGDQGIAAQSMLLGAIEKGLGGCMIGAFKQKGLRQALNIPNHYEISLVLALGKPKEIVVIDPVDSDGNVKYWRDAQGIHHVPKRSLESMIVG